MKKKIISVFLTALLVLVTSACQGGRADESDASVSQSGEVSAPITQTHVTTKTDVDYNMSFTAGANGTIEKGDEISPFIYGEFLEHIPGCVYGVIWSELILDRKFYYPAGEEGLSPWSVMGSVESVDDRYSLNGHAAKLNANSSIFQSVMLNKQSYDGYFYAKGGGDIVVTIGDETFEFSTDSEYKKYSFSYAATTAKKYNVMYKCVSGVVTLDSLSLMPSDNYCGMRRDVLDAMKSLNGTIYRWPGGNFVSGYNWKDGVGDRDKRASLRNPAWFPDKGDIESDKQKLAGGDFYGRIEPNDMGTEEFLAMCEYIGATPYLAVNTGTGSVQDAVDYVNYCNSTNTSYGLKRITNGHVSPYNVKYWCVGNEMQGDWQLGHTTIDKYTAIHNSFVNAMLSADGKIVVTGCGDNFSDWTDGMFRSCASNLDYIGEHLYAEREDENDLQTHVIKTLNNFTDRIQRHRALIKKYPSAKNVKIAFDEYAYDWNGKANMRDALGIAATLNLFIKNCDVVGMANYSDAVFKNESKNAPGAVNVYADKTAFSPVGYVLKAYAENMLKYRATVNVKQTDNSINLYYEATVSHDGKTVAIAVVNVSDKNVGLICKNDMVASKQTTVYAPNETSLTATFEEITAPDRIVLTPRSVNVIVMNIE